MSNTNIYYEPDKTSILTFMKTYLPQFDEQLDYQKWHYVKDFTKNCKYHSQEHYKNIELMRKLEQSIEMFQLEHYKNCDLSNIRNVKRIKLSAKPTIFVYWHQGKDTLPELQLLCYKRLIQKCSNKFNILLLDSNTIESYIDIHDVIKKAMVEKRIWLQFYTDYIRFALLSKYEGIWFDATIFVKDDLEKVNFNVDFWSIKCKAMFKNTWAENVIPEMCKCQTYTLSGTSSYFYQCMKQLIEYHFENFDVQYTYYMAYYMAKYLYMTNDTIKQQFDNLYYNNEDVEYFANNRSLTIDKIAKQWSTITDTHLFKLLKFQTKEEDAYKIYEFMKGIYENDRHK